jgi:hypothetical protein
MRFLFEIKLAISEGKISILVSHTVSTWCFYREIQVLQANTKSIKKNKSVLIFAQGFLRNSLHVCSNLVHSYTINKVCLAEIFRIIYHLLRQALSTSLTSCWNFTSMVSCNSYRILIERTNKMQLCRIIYYSIVPRLLYMFRAILSLIIRSILTVITASASIHMCCCRLLSWLSTNYSIVPCLLYMFPAILSLIIRSILTVITACGFIHMCCCRLVPWLSRNYSATTLADNNTCE